MTPDPTDSTPHDDEQQHGVLDETGAIDTAGYGLFGDTTAQVNVSLPGESDDDLDDDVVGDEVPLHAEFDVIETAEGEIIETDAVDWAATPGASAGDAFDGAVAEVVDVPDDEVVYHVATDDAGAQSTPAVRASAPVVPPAPPTTPASWSATASAAAPASDPTPAASVAASTTPASTPTTGATSTARATTTGSTPTTRREAHHPASARHKAVERSSSRSEVALTSKRLGEFEGGRESADLLTADRLLDPHQVVKPEPEGAWQHFVYSLTGRRVNLGDGKRARERKELDRRIAAPLTGGARFVPVLSRKGGVGKTTITTLLGMALADARDDRVVAVDANPDRGTLADRIARSSGKTVRDLVRVSADVNGFNDLSSIVARDETRLDVLASDTDPRVSEAFSDVDYRDVASLAARYYSIVLTDTGTGIVHSVMEATLEHADQLIIVAGLSVDEARLASETLTWLETNGYAEQVRGAIVVLNNSRPGTPIVRLDELEAHFRTRVRAVVRMPYDPQIAAGSAIAFRDLQQRTRQAARELAAVVVEGLRALAPAA